MPRSTEHVAWFEFEDLCEAALGAAEYLSLTRRYHTVFVHNVPRFVISRNRNEMRRFITFVDVAYENHVKLFVAAAAPPMALYVPDPQPGSSKGAAVFAGEEEHFAFDRTVSRLIEMQSEAYLQRHASAHQPQPVEQV